MFLEHYKSKNYIIRKKNYVVGYNRKQNQIINISDCTRYYLIIMFLFSYARIHAHSVMSDSLQPQGP